MKKMVSWILAMLLLLLPCAFAEGKTMVIANCDEWVSLRESASTGAQRLAEVPLGAVVTDCEWAESGFYRCTYQGQTGYILSDYLDEAELYFQGEDFTVLASRSYPNYTSETITLTVTVKAADGSENIWGTTFTSPTRTELQCTNAFIGGTADKPQILVHVSGVGLYSLDVYTAEELWTIPSDKMSFGGSLSCAVDANGTAYIGGYYGPDPVAVSAEGEILWQAQPEGDPYWLYEMEVTEEGVVATYDCADGVSAAGKICFSLEDGSEIGRIEE